MEGGFYKRTEARQHHSELRRTEKTRIFTARLLHARCAMHGVITNVKHTALLFYCAGVEDRSSNEHGEITT